MTGIVCPTWPYSLNWKGDKKRRQGSAKETQVVRCQHSNLWGVGTPNIPSTCVPFHHAWCERGVKFQRKASGPPGLASLFRWKLSQRLRPLHLGNPRGPERAPPRARRTWRPRVPAEGAEPSEGGAASNGAGPASRSPGPAGRLGHAPAGPARAPEGTVGVVGWGGHQPGAAPPPADARSESCVPTFSCPVLSPWVLGLS
jgi:hypothetical protein